MSLALPRAECQATGLPGRPLSDRASRPAPTLAPGKTRTMEFRPLHDRVLVRRVTAEEKTAGGIIIPDTAKEKPQEGEVVSVGPGTLNDKGELRPLDVKAGDRILFGKWSGTEVKLGNEELLIMKESDILGVLEGQAAAKKAA
jgi:chaperonin GroES